MFIYLLHIVSLQLNFTAKVLLFLLICNSLECLYSIYTVFLLIICLLQRKCTDCYFEVFTHIRSKIWPYMYWIFHFVCKITLFFRIMQIICRFGSIFLFFRSLNMYKKWGHDSLASSKVVNYFEMRKKMPLMRVLHK